MNEVFEPCGNCGHSSDEHYDQRNGSQACEGDGDSCFCGEWKPAAPESTPPASFAGHSPRECGEHRTVGAHRAWCHDCREWCYPASPCKGCERPALAATLAHLTFTVATSSNDWASHPTDAWIYGIICGWDAGALEVLAARHGWNEDMLARLRSHRHTFAQAARQDEEI